MARHTATPNFIPGQIHAFRLRRHHLLEPEANDLVTICRDICGAQAQIMSAAQLQLWARNHGVTPAAVNDALWKTRSLVKATLMRQTLHLVPADEFCLYSAAQRNTRVRAVLAIMARLKITPEEAAGLSALILQTLESGPLPHQAIASAVRPKVSKRVRAWMDRVSSVVRLTACEGLICYGPGEGAQATFVRTDHWLPGRPQMEEAQAQKELFRKYLRAYAPATLKDFAYWAGISMAQARALRPLLDADVVDCNGLLVLREDLKALQAKPGNLRSVHLLPYFDVYLLGHSVKDHLLEQRLYKRVYRNQGWIMPVVLIDGRIAGVWAYEPSRQAIHIQIELFSRASRELRKQIEARARELADFFQKTPAISFL